MDKLARYALISLALLGTIAGASLSTSHLQTGETCPMLGPLPACYVVFIGYMLIPSAHRILLTRPSSFNNVTQ